MNICIISKFAPKDIDQAKVAFCSYLMNNFRDNYCIHILTSYSSAQYSAFAESVQNYAEITFHDEDILRHIYTIRDKYDFIIILNHKTLTLQSVDENFKKYIEYDMIGGLRYNTEFDLIYSGINIPFVGGVFSNGFMMLRKPTYELNDIKDFEKTYNISKAYKGFTEIFLSFVCMKKLNLDISNECLFFHSEHLEDLKIIYFTDGIYPWKIGLKNTAYIFYYLKRYLKCAKMLKCSENFIDRIQGNERLTFKFSEYQRDLKERFVFRSSDKVFIPISERKLRLKIF